jgi:hypothetical protein
MTIRFNAAWGGLVLAVLLLAAPAPAQTPQEFLDQAVYRHSFAEHTIRVSPRDFNFMVDNLVGVLAVASQPGFRRRHPQLAGLNLDRLGGTPRDFTVGAHNQQARVRMRRLGDKQILYLADVSLNKLGLSITGRTMALVTLSYDNPGDPMLRAKLTVAFQPSSAVLAVALKPLLGAFGQEMNRMGQRVLGLADEFIGVYQEERDGAFSRSGLLSQAAAINQQRLELARRVRGGGPAAKDAPGGAALWALGLGGAALLLVLGLLAGFFWADRSRARREARLLRHASRAQGELEAMDRQLSKLLARRGLSREQAQAALAEHQRLSRVLAARVKQADSLDSA